MANEKRLIYANDPLKQLSDYMEKLHCSDDYRDGLYRGMEIAESYIKNAPTVDAVEVVHTTTAIQQMQTISVPTDKGERENENLCKIYARTDGLCGRER